MSRQPLVTVFIPLHNRQDYIGEAIDSILRQTLDDFELLVVDDCSTDASTDVVTAYTDPRIRLVRNPSNLGTPGTRNVGIQQARGRYMAMLDDDDIAHPERLARQVAYLETHASIALVGTFFERFTDDGGIQDRCEVVTAPEDVHATMIFKCSLHNPTIMGRTAVLQRYSYNPKFFVGQDYEVFARMRDHHALANLPEYLTRYRLHDTQATLKSRPDLHRNYLAIYRGILTRLGMDFTELDLERHYLLSVRRAEFAAEGPLSLNADYLIWAAQWLHRIARSHARADAVASASVERVCAGLWRRLCAKAAKANGVLMWRYYFKSSLWIRGAFDPGARFSRR